MELETEVAPPTLVELLPPALNPPRQRADLLKLKARLASLLPPEEGQEYWAALVGFITGKINRHELGSIMDRVLGTKGEAVQLHNALLLAILYNTTRTTLPPSAVRHAGWHKRHRDKDGFKLEDRDPKRRKLKAAVMAIGKRERAEIKTLGLGRKEVDLDAEGPGMGLAAALDSRGGAVDAEGLPLALVSDKPASAELLEEYRRCLKAPLCCDSKLLPDIDTLKDRMSLIAYENGLDGGADARVAALGVQAIEGHLRSMIAGVVSLIRHNRANGIQTTSAAQLLHLASISDPAQADRPEITVSAANGSTIAPRADDESAQPGDAPLALSDFSSLFEISPHLLVQPRLAAIERLYALPPISDSESSDESSDDEDDATPKATATEGTGSKSSLRPLSRSGSRSNRSLSNGGPAKEGREQFLIDIAAISSSIPSGHPDVAHPRLGSLSMPPNPPNGVGSPNPASAPAALGRTSSAAGPVSPKSLSLRNQLFPELEPEGGVVDSPLPIPQSPSMDTTTDAASESEDEATKAKNKGKNGAVDPKKAARKLWEVVDSKRLLEGVLD
ncbi:hypothetical protein MNV49_007822 [Pseudohyphozyma bogoriensis]|nr:hypothetical protein MNV49_007822 [Pseudohyphozyma bogoriensis]